jgi:hypothetical protein
MRDLYGAEVYVLLSVREGESASGKADDAEKNEEKSDNGCGFQWMGNLSCSEVFKYNILM